MANEIISYLEMCQREGVSLQKGMNFHLNQTHSVILMSTRPNAPYRDRIEDEGLTIVYEGHDVPSNRIQGDPKLADQVAETPSGRLTENGKFYQAAEKYRNGSGPAERVRVYEKIRQGIWSYNGLFGLVDAWIESDGRRRVYKFRLEAIEDDSETTQVSPSHSERTRVIPSEVKLEVWKRDLGHCRVCGSEDELHFDHIIPYSRGGTSLKAENIQLLCARHNLEKRDKII